MHCTRSVASDDHLCVQNGDWLDFKIKADPAFLPPGASADAQPLDNRCWALAGAPIVHCGPFLCTFGGRHGLTMTACPSLTGPLPAWVKVSA